MSATVKGRLNWEKKQDKEGHRDYDIEWLVRCTSTLDGPQVAMGAAGLAAIGSTWTYGNDNDPWALCWPEMSAKPVIRDEPGIFWVVQQMFTTRPLKRCQDTPIENPLDEPPQISGSFVKYTREAIQDRFGMPLVSTSHEMFRGSAVERDYNRPTVSVAFNLLTLPLETFSEMIDTLNDSSLWGLDARKIKLSQIRWERKLYGTCTFYYTVQYDFDIDFEGFDRDILNEGTRVLCPGGDVTNPTHFKQYKDTTTGGSGHVLLDEDGNALADGEAPYYRHFELYNESNFLLLDIPTSL